mgnify:FL=1
MVSDEVKESIVNDYNQGKKIRDLSEKYDLSEKSIRNILKEKGIDYSREWKEKRQRIKEQAQGNTEKSNEKHSEKNGNEDLCNDLTDLTEDLMKELDNYKSLLNERDKDLNDLRTQLTAMTVEKQKIELNNQQKDISIRSLEKDNDKLKGKVKIWKVLTFIFLIAMIVLIVSILYPLPPIPYPSPLP